VSEPVDGLVLGTVLLVEARHRSGLTKDEVARQMAVPIEIIDGIEAISEDSYLSLMLRYAETVGAKVTIEIIDERVPRSRTRGGIRPPGRST